MGEWENRKWELGMRPPASPSCRLYLRAGSHRGIGPTPRRECGIKKEGEGWKWELGPAVVLNEGDYGAANM
jgi:hypothetical protein